MTSDDELEYIYLDGCVISVVGQALERATHRAEARRPPLELVHKP